LDLNLPKIGGKDVLARIKADVRPIDIPVIVFSSSSDPATFWTLTVCMPLAMSLSRLNGMNFLRPSDNSRSFGST
jgi:CheY-like chemotaxis protein